MGDNFKDINECAESLQNCFLFLIENNCQLLNPNKLGKSDFLKAVILACSNLLVGSLCTEMFYAKKNRDDAEELIDVFLKDFKKIILERYDDRPKPWQH